VLFLVGSAKPGRVFDSVGWRYLSRRVSIVCSSAFNNSIHRCATDPELLGYRSGTESLTFQLHDRGRIDRRLATLLDARLFGLR
jgi:hypothetical protein